MASRNLTMSPLRFILGYESPPDRPVSSANRSFPTITAGRRRRRFFAPPGNGLAPIPVAFPTPGGAPGLAIRAGGQVAPAGVDADLDET